MKPLSYQVTVVTGVAQHSPQSALSAPTGAYTYMRSAVLWPGCTCSPIKADDPRFVRHAEECDRDADYDLPRGMVYFVPADSEASK